MKKPEIIIIGDYLLDKKVLEEFEAKGFKVTSITPKEAQEEGILLDAGTIIEIKEAEPIKISTLTEHLNYMPPPTRSEKRKVERSNKKAIHK